MGTPRRRATASAAATTSESESKSTVEVGGARRGAPCLGGSPPTLPSRGTKP
jgi:hypothetical protein